MIEKILTDAVRDGQIVSWRPMTRLLFPNTWEVDFYDDQPPERYTREGIENLVVDLAIFRGEIPDPNSNEGSYPCF